MEEYEKTIQNIKIDKIEGHHITLESFEEYTSNGCRTIYNAKLIEDDSNKEVGYINFVKSKNKLWLTKIEVDKEYQGKGYGSLLLSLLDYVALSTRTNSIEGKYFPTVDYGKHFYEKNGYTIEKDGYETFIYKYLYDKEFENLKNKFTIEKVECIKNEMSL